MAKSDLPNANVVGSGNLTNEMSQYNYLYSLVPRTTTTDITFTSSSSNITYSTATYSSGKYANQGQNGMLSILGEILANYVPTSTDFNNKTETSAFNAHLADNTPHGATPTATANKLALRDSSGNLSANDFKVGTYSVIQAISGMNKVQTGSTNSVVATAGTTATVTVTFPVAFTNLVPIVTVGITGASIADAGYINVRPETITLTGITFKVNSYLAQTIYFGWEAMGT